MNEVWNFDMIRHFITDFKPLLHLEVTGRYFIVLIVTLLFIKE